MAKFTKEKEPFTITSRTTVRELVKRGLALEGVGNLSPWPNRCPIFLLVNNNSMSNNNRIKATNNNQSNTMKIWPKKLWPID
ncbi:hypothetical protein COLO4_32065 [Corchorus olitorius]|uniref:Uncharacterized protein n=1 Tax=Corchorus olitorius TaxID=93759 RepID=A0A1R3H287_9ROSI|nr:hypothetical protein COLO4_32065 [Corchorus olitorius]